MLVKSNNLRQINNSEFESIPMQKFSRFTGISLSYLSRVKHNKVIISEDWYEELMKHLTRFVKYSKLERERGGKNDFI